MVRQFLNLHHEIQNERRTELLCTQLPLRAYCEAHQACTTKIYYSLGKLHLPLTSLLHA